MKKQREKIIDKLIIIGLSLAVVVFILLPFLSVFKQAFFLDGRLNFTYFFKTLIENTHLLKNSLMVGVLSTVLTTILSGILSIYIYLSDDKFKKIFFAILLITLISPPFVTSVAYFQLFGRRGWISHGLLGLSIRAYGLWPIVFLLTIGDISLNSLLFLSFLRGTDKSLIVSARSFGAKTDDIIRDILLPALKPGLKAVMILTFFGNIADFTTPTLVGGNFNVLSFASYSAVISEGNATKAAALNILMLLPAIPAYYIYQKSSGFGSLTEGLGSGSVEIPIPRKGVLYNLAKAISFIILFILTSLYGAIIVSAFTRMQKGSLVFSLQNFVDTLPYLNETTLRSIGYSLIAAVLGSLIGLLIGYYLKIRKLKFMGFIDFAASLPYMIPGTFFGLGYLLFFSKPPMKITGTALIVVLNIIFKQLPFSTKIGNSAMEAINTEVLDSIRDLGGSPTAEIRDAIIPLSSRPLAVSFINIFRSTMTTMGTIIFLVTPGRKVLTLVMFEAIRAGKYNVGSVLALVIIVICILVYGIYFLIMRRIEDVLGS